MIENLYFFYIKKFEIFFKVYIFVLILLILYCVIRKNNSKKILTVFFITMFCILGYNFWMNGYSQEFGLKYANISLDNRREIILEKYENRKDFSKRDISIIELSELVKGKTQIKIMIKTLDEKNYMIWYFSRPENYGVFECAENRKCLRIGTIENKDFFDLIKKQIKEEE